MDDILIVALGWIGSAVIGYYAAGVRLIEFTSELTFVKNNVMFAKAIRGGEARVRNEERLEEAIAEAMAIFQNKNLTDEQKQGEYKGLLSKYPDVAVRLGKKLLWK